MNNTLICGVDLETSGVSVTNDAPVQVGVVLRLHDHGSYADYPAVNMLCNPGKPIEPGATAVHGITDAQVAYTPSAYDVVRYMAQTVAYYAHGRTAFTVGFNSSNFDIPMANHVLGYEAFSLPHIDVLRLIRFKFPGARGSLGGKKLGEMYEVFLGRPLQNAHDAIVDISATLDLLEALQQRTGMSMAEIAEEQSQPHPYQILPLGRYIGLPIAEVPRSWATFMQDKDLDPDLRATVDTILARP